MAVLLAIFLSWIVIGQSSQQDGFLQSQFYQPWREYLAPKPDLKIENVSFPSTDNVTLAGWYIHSKTPPKGLVVLFHGNAQNLSTHYTFLDWVTDEGYDFFIFDYRGYGISTGTTTSAGTVDDGVAALRFADDRSVQYEIETKKKLPLIVVGQSLGGAIALRSISEVAGWIPIRLLVLESTFISYVRVAKTWAADHYLGWADSMAENMNDTYAPASRLHHLKGIPKIIIHGSEDTIVNYVNGVELFDQIPGPKQFWRVEGGLHTEAFYTYRKIYGPRLIEIMDKAVAGRKPF